MENIICSTTEKEKTIISNNISKKMEKHEDIDYKNKICKKPWGHEFLIYESNKIGIWFLKINKGHKTSLHCHFNKDTIIIGLNGCTRIELIDNNIQNVDNMKAIFLPHGNFHSIGSYSDETYLIEIEIFNNTTTFSDKNDLLRIDDKYKRKDNIYNTSIDLIYEDLHNYDYFYLNNDFEKTIQDVDFKITEINDTTDFSQFNKYNYNILIEGVIFQNFKYYKEGSIIDSFSNIQFINDKAYILSLKKYSYNECSKIIYDNEQLSVLVKKYKDQHKKIILSSGCFDILHVGHIQNLLKAKQLGDILMICLSSDEQIKQLKGPDRPINNYEDRINLFKTIVYVDHIILYNEKDNQKEETLGEIMKIVDPYYWVKGTDYDINDIFKKHPYLKNIKLLDNIETKSSTNIIKKIRNSV